MHNMKETTQVPLLVSCTTMQNVTGEYDHVAEVHVNTLDGASHTGDIEVTALR